MISIINKNIIKIKHVLFTDNFNFKNEKIDLLFIHGLTDFTKCKFTNKGVLKKQFSLIQDLKLDEKDIWKQFTKTNQNEIRRCINANIIYKRIDKIETIEDFKILKSFKHTYNDMFKKRHMKNKFNTKYIMNLSKSNNLLITVGYYSNKPIVFHAYLKDNNNCELMYSTSIISNDGEMKKNIGRINKYLHWKDMLLLKKDNIMSLDWGGLFSIENPNGIDKFKMSFGGVPITYYTVIYAYSWIGKIVLKIFEAKNRRLTIKSQGK